MEKRPLRVGGQGRTIIIILRTGPTRSGFIMRHYDQVFRKTRTLDDQSFARRRAAGGIAV